MTNKMCCPFMIMQMPMMTGMEMYDSKELASHDMYEEDEEDENYMMTVYPEVCHKIMPAVKDTVDKMDYKDSPMYELYPDRKFLDEMIGKTYDKVAKDILQMEEKEDNRQFYYSRPSLARGLVGALLLGEILRRRRAHRRGFYGPVYYPPYGGYPVYDYYYYED